jgi:hypothetical protein
VVEGEKRRRLFSDKAELKELARILAEAAGVLLLALTMYVGAYFCMVRSVGWVPVYSATKSSDLRRRWFFRPMHAYDRDVIRPHLWNPPLPGRPLPTHPPQQAARLKFQTDPLPANRIEP